ncbi:MAG: cyclic nucleotide-binding domain-containing protein [Thermodesulfobacteriota bacterium]
MSIADIAAVKWFQWFGYLAAFLMFSTFYMKKMIPLRAVGIASNVTFIVFASMSHVWPLLILHICLLPLNISRMVQMMRLVSKVKEAAKGGFSMNFLVPFMKLESFKEGDVVFSRGDEADKMYYLQKGNIRLKELGITLTPGEIIGEMGIFSTNKKRNATVVCETDADLYTIPDSHVLQLYYQNPEFGIYLVQMILKRLTEKAEKMGTAAAGSTDTPVTLVDNEVASGEGTVT